MNMNLQEIEKNLYTLEQKLQLPNIRKNQAELDCLLADDFVEFGSSGRIWNKKEIIEGLLNETSYVITMEDFNVKWLGADVALVTYQVVGTSKVSASLRSSIWKKNENFWQMIFHQGTKT
ncbi:nuclear transport factor 2 family protein [Bacillus timonensis]|nr:nuclear transport factor 2 family protein [Bacillus timonensis]